MSSINKVNNQMIQSNSYKASTNAINTDFSSFLGETKSLDSIFQKAADTYKVDVNLLKSIGKAESDFREKVVSRSGAVGIMQLMPATAKYLGVKDSYDAEQNIMGGAKYIKELLNKYDGDTSLALAAYNAGMGNVAKYNGIPPFEETQNYVKKVHQFMKSEIQTGITVSSNGMNSNGSSLSSTVTSTAAKILSPIYTSTNFDQTVEERLASESSDYDNLFSYNKYLEFLDLYMKYMDSNENSNEELEKKYSTAQEAYNASAPVFNLLNQIKL